MGVWSPLIRRLPLQPSRRRTTRTSACRPTFNDRDHQRKIATGGHKMFITTDIHPRRVLNQLSHLVLCFALVTCAAHSQEKQSLPDRRPYAVDVANVPDAIAKVKSGDFAAVHVDLIARA